MRLRPGGPELRTGVDDVRWLGLEIIAEQLELSFERGEGRTDLVRCGGHEGPPDAFLLAQSRLHGRKGAGELAYLVTRVVEGHLGIEPVHGESAGGVLEATQPPQERGGESDTQHDRRAEADERRGEKCAL